MEDENLNIATSRRARAGVNPEPGTDQFRLQFIITKYATMDKFKSDPLWLWYA